ncbi:MAG: flagellar biosynthesis anti-sigma factor FlgM [Rhodoferax sp.]|nr:flagellar biosynthesis anti-sigma factor FlgM [Rhodoferax sp.]MBJ7467207.1 flagellar biosynthesis anti-sigma factor FlgM [Rhodoferax sp.]
MRRSLEKAKGGGFAGAVAQAAPSESEIAASKTAAAQRGAEVPGFKKITERLNKEPEFDRAKVDSIKQAIQNGQYPLNPRRIAESFVALENLISN